MKRELALLLEIAGWSLPVWFAQALYWLTVKQFYVVLLHLELRKAVQKEMEQEAIPEATQIAAVITTGNNLSVLTPHWDQ